MNKTYTLDDVKTTKITILNYGHGFRKTRGEIKIIGLMNTGKI